MRPRGARDVLCRPGMSRAGQVIPRAVETFQPNVDPGRPETTCASESRREPAQWDELRVWDPGDGRAATRRGPCVPPPTLTCGGGTPG